MYTGLPGRRQSGVRHLAGGLGKSIDEAGERDARHCGGRSRIRHLAGGLGKGIVEVGERPRRGYCRGRREAYATAAAQGRREAYATAAAGVAYTTWPVA